MAINGNNPTPDKHMEVLYRQTYNTLGAITTAGLTKDNYTGNSQQHNNSRLSSSTAKGILAGSVVAVVGSGSVGPCTGDNTVADMAVGIAVNDAVGNPFESSSAVASNKVVYLHGSGSVFRTDIYETKGTDGTAAVTYAYGDMLYSSRNGILTNSLGLDRTSNIGTAYTSTITPIAIVLEAPVAGNNYYMTAQMRI